ncbi:hypothetical protein Holit_02140 [Hollandina sp. SP2]
MWYEIRTRINNREPLFHRYNARTLFIRVFQETERRFSFRVRRLRLEGDGVSFYINPKKAAELPAIMKWMKQTFAQRYNRDEGRSGHIWGDRYGSRIVEGDMVGEAELDRGVRPLYGETTEIPFFQPTFPHPNTPRPG